MGQGDGRGVSQFQQALRVASTVSLQRGQVHSGSGCSGGWDRLVIDWMKLWTICMASVRSVSSTQTSGAAKPAAPPRTARPMGWPNSLRISLRIPADERVMRSWSQSAMYGEE